MPPFETDADIAAELIRSVRPRFLAVDSSGLSPARMYGLPVARQFASSWDLVWRDPAGLLLLYEASTHSRASHGSSPARKIKYGHAEHSGSYSHLQ